MKHLPHAALKLTPPPSSEIRVLTRNTTAATCLSPLDTPSSAAVGVKMQPGRANLPADYSPEAPAGRPGFVGRCMPMNHPVPASAVRDFPPDPEPDVRTGRPLHGGTVYMELTPEQSLSRKRFGYAYINNPGPAAEVADPNALVRSAILAAAPELQFEVLGCSPMMADVGLRFGTPEDREAAIAKQPFELDGVSVEVVREGEQRNVRRVTLQHLAHIAFLNYLVEERTEEGVRANCTNIGPVVEIDPGCFAAPDLAPVHLVVRLKDPGSIPAGVRLRYLDHTRTVCPVEVAQCFIPSGSGKRREDTRPSSSLQWRRDSC